MVIKRIGSMYFVLPMTTGGKDNVYYYTLPKSYFKKTSRIILSQARCIDKKRFTHKLATINMDDFAAIKEKIRASLL